MKTCKHIILYGLAGIPATGGDYCCYCVEEDIEKWGVDSVYVCQKPTCPDYEGEKPHHHPAHAETIGTPTPRL